MPLAAGAHGEEVAETTFLVVDVRMPWGCGLASAQAWSSATLSGWFRFCLFRG